MEPPRLQHLLTIVDKAQTLEGEERARYLNEICDGDAGLKAEVGELLESIGASESFWQSWKQWNEKQIAGLFQKMEQEDPTDLADQHLGQYHLLERLGAGGMGVVYRAYDTRLKRDVAIKVLRQGMPGSLTSRVLREARAASALNHPNIVTIHEVGRHDDIDFIVMEYVDGEPLDAVIRQGPPEIEKALPICIQIADGLAAAHAKELVHRDIKPGNVVITSAGQAKILDFGVARQVQTTGRTDPQDAIAGTPGYIAPELFESGFADPRSDVFALGVTLYQYISGKQPFGEKAEITATLQDDPKPLIDVRSDTPAGLARIVEQCLARRPEDRYPSAQEVVRDLKNLQSPVMARMRRTTRIGGVALIVVILSSIVAFGWWYIQDRQVRWAREEAIPQIEQLADDNRIVEAFLLAEEAARLAPADPVLRELMNRLSVPVDINSDPPGTEVSFQDYRAPEGPFHTLGRTPLKAVRVPAPMSVLRWRVKREGYDTFEVAETPLLGALDFDLTPVGDTPPDMHRVPAGSEQFQANEPIRVPAFWLDTYEVTNREFQEFVDAGGYEEPRYWTRAIEAAGNEYTWEELMARFRDSTGQPGPATWSSGRYPEGTGDHPVGGVSWFEAVAYAEFTGKSLPTASHWRRATPWSPFGDMLLLGRFQANGSVPVGSSRAVGRYGHHDLAGNVGEWVWNEAPGGQRYILGGSWAEPSYIFMTHTARSPFERGPDFGIRLARYDSPPPPELSEPVTIKPHDFSQEEPVSDEIFDVFRSYYAYDPLPLDSRVESVDDSPQHWQRETVSFNAAYGGERVIAHLFLPRDVPPPYKTVVYAPGVGAYYVRSIDDASGEGLFVPRSGRALVFPAYKGMLERGGGETQRGELSPREHRDQMIQSVNDLQRTIDYLETREDIDTGSLAYLGVSWGGEYGPVFTAIEQRFATLVYLAGGFDNFRLPEEIKPWHYAPRVTTPTLMVNGRDDYFSPVETAQKPMFDLLGVPPEHKRHVILEGGHMPYDMNEVIRETLDWLDRYQGRPAPASTAETEATASHSLAVLPFANTSPNAENEYFADGVTDDILTHLAQVPDFSVISRTTMMSYKGSGKSIPEIAEELGVEYLLEGSVRRAGDQVRITARLLKAGMDQTLWNERYDRKLEDIFAVQTDIAGAIAGALETELSGDVASRIERPPTEDLEAYDLFLVGRASLYRYDREGLERAIEHFSQAVGKDPDFALARAWLGRALSIHVFSFGMDRSLADSAVTVASRAVEDQPDLSDAHTALGSALVAAGRHEESVPPFEQALALNPSDWIATGNLGLTYAMRGNWDESIRLTRRSLELDPAWSQIAYWNLSEFYWKLGLYAQAESALDRAEALAPGHSEILFHRAMLYLLRGEHDSALAIADRITADAGTNPLFGVYAAQIFVLAGNLERALVVAEATYEQSPTATNVYLLGVLYGYALERKGQSERARSILAETERYARERIDAGDELNGLRYSLSGIHALRGETDEAFRWLDEAIDFGWNVAAITALDPLLESLREDPRFQTALDSMQRDLAAMRERVEREGW